MLALKIKSFYLLLYYQELLAWSLDKKNFDPFTWGYLSYLFLDEARLSNKLPEYQSPASTVTTKLSFLSPLTRGKCHFGNRGQGSG